jgi:N utilization substance protein B
LPNAAPAASPPCSSSTPGASTSRRTWRRTYASFFENLEEPREHYAFGEELIHGVIEQCAELDARIKGLAQNWDFERIARIDLAILRIAMFEMVFRKDIPPVVSINEAIDLSKQFSNADAKRFINGILDRLKDQLGRDARKADSGE